MPCSRSAVSRSLDEVARVIEFFAGPMGTFVSGQVLRIDGGGQSWPG